MPKFELINTFDDLSDVNAQLIVEDLKKKRVFEKPLQKVAKKTSRKSPQSQIFSVVLRRLFHSSSIHET